MKILIINGPNLNMLEYRDKKIYGNETFESLQQQIFQNYPKINVKIVQTNSEGKFIDFIQEAIFRNYDGIIINPAAYSHYSYAIADSLEMFKNIKVEVHLSDVKNREKFRKKMITGENVDKIISGKGMDGYIEALEYIINQI